MNAYLFNAIKVNIVVAIFATILIQQGSRFDCNYMIRQEFEMGTNPFRPNSHYMSVRPPARAAGGIAVSLPPSKVAVGVAVSLPPVPRAAVDVSLLASRKVHVGAVVSLPPARAAVSATSQSCCLCASAVRAAAALSLLPRISQCADWAESRFFKQALAR